VALTAVAISCATARADGVIQIDTATGGSQTVSLSELGTPKVPYGSYDNVATPGGVAQTVTVTNGYTLPQLFIYLNKHFQISPTSFGSVEIVAPEGPPVVLNSAQATSATAYEGGPPVVWADGAGTHFLEPSTPSGTVNAGETFTGTITIQLHRGPPLSVGISTSELKAVVNKPVQFSSQVYGGTALSYQWSFGDDTIGSAADPSHVYTALGTYSISLGVTGTDDTVGASPVIQVVVGNPPKVLPNPGAGTGGSGTGGTGVGTGGSGSGTGTGTGGHGASTKITTSGHRHASKRSPKRRTKPLPRSTGPIVSGIEISYITPAASSAAAAAGSAAAARAATAKARAAGLNLGMWIWFAVLVMLFGGAVLEWSGPRRARLALARAS
jgi:PKD domain